MKTPLWLITEYAPLTERTEGTGQDLNQVIADRRVYGLADDLEVVLEDVIAAAEERAHQEFWAREAQWWT